MRRILAVRLLAALLCGCAGLGDWDAPLVGDYSLCRLSGYQIVLVREHENSSGSEIVLGP